MKLTKADGIQAACVVTAAVLVAAEVAWAQCEPRLLHELFNDDGRQGDRFGQAVGLSDEHIIVGAAEDQIDTVYCGSAMLFDARTGLLLFKFVPEIRREGQFFGVSVDVDDALAIIGAHRDYNERGRYSGAAYLFDCRTGAQVLKLAAADGENDNLFGTSVSMSGGVAIVGAPRHRHGQIETGAAYVFDVTTGAQLAELLPDTSGIVSGFGTSVAIRGDLAVVGAPRSGAGQVDVFGIADPGAPRRIATIFASDGEWGDRFGASVAIADERIIIGAPGDDDLGDQSGSAYLFDISDPSAPVEVAKLLRENGGVKDHFGHAVGVSGETAIVSAWYLDDFEGYSTHFARLFDARTGEGLSELRSTAGRRDRGFGRSVAILSGTAVVGSNLDDADQSSWGIAYVFDVDCLPLLWRTGSCPGVMRLIARGVSANEQAVFVAAHAEGMLRIPDTRLSANTKLGLDGTAFLAGMARADSKGVARLSVRVREPFCRRIHVQAIDVSTCETSNVVLIE